jgi:hypothetical protein
MIQVQQIRQMQQQTELLRQQTEALRHQNQQNQTVAAQPIDDAALARQVENSPEPAPSMPVSMKASADSQKTAGLFNGRGWNMFSQFLKLAFLTGALEAVQVASVTEVAKYFPGTLTMVEFVLAIDRFYEAPENRPIPILYAIRAATMKANGEDPIAFEMTVAAMRKAALDVR